MRKFIVLILVLAIIFGGAYLGLSFKKRYFDTSQIYKGF